MKKTYWVVSSFSDSSELVQTGPLPIRRHQQIPYTLHVLQNLCQLLLGGIRGGSPPPPPLMGITQQQTWENRDLRVSYSIQPCLEVNKCKRLRKLSMRLRNVTVSQNPYDELVSTTAQGLRNWYDLKLWLIH